MRRIHYLLAVAVVMVALVAGGACAQTTMWLSADAAGTPIPADTINVAPGGSVQLYCFLNSADVGNTFEIMVGYDRSDATTHGAGVDTNDGAAKKLTLSSTQNDIVTSSDAWFVPRVRNSIPAITTPNTPNMPSTTPIASIYPPPLP